MLRRRAVPLTLATRASTTCANAVAPVHCIEAASRNRRHDQRIPRRSDMEFIRKIISHSPSDEKWQWAVCSVGIETAHSPLSFFKGFKGVIAIKAFRFVQRVQIVSRDQTLNRASSDSEHIGCALAVAVILL